MLPEKTKIGTFFTVRLPEKMANVPEIKIVRSESLGHRSDVSSPESKLGMRVEDLWDEQKPQLSPNEKLNACFESIPVSAFPLSSDSQGYKTVC